MSTFRIRLTRKRSKDGELQAQHPVSLLLDKEANEDARVGGLFRSAFEIEMLRGSRRALANGAVIYRFEVDGERATKLAQGITWAAFQTPGASTEN